MLLPLLPFSIRFVSCFASSRLRSVSDTSTAATPVQDTRLPDAREPEETYAYSLEEIAAILAQLPEPAATIFAVAAYSGLRRSEIEGLRWEDYSDGDLHVTQSIVMGKVTRPKSRA